MDLTPEELETLFAAVHERDMKLLQERNALLKELLAKTQAAIDYRPSKNGTRQIPPEGCGGEQT